MSSYQQHLEIEAWLNGELSAAQRQDFEQRLNEDPELKEAVDMTATVDAIVMDAEVLRLRAKLQEIHTNQPTQKRKGYGPWGVGLLLLSLLTAAVFWLNSGSGDIDQSNTSSSSKVSSPESQSTMGPAQSASESQDQTQLSLDPSDPSASPSAGESVVSDTPGSRMEPLGPNRQHLPTAADSGSRRPLHMRDPSHQNAGGTTPPKSQSGPDCSKVAEMRPQYELNQPCFGPERGQIEFEEYVGDVHFTHFSTDGGQTFLDYNLVSNLKVDRYTLMAVTEDGCATRQQTIDFKFASCSYVVRPSRYDAWRMDTPDMDIYPLRLEVRNARTGQLAFEHTFGSRQVFEWYGTDNNGQSLPMAAYVYRFVSPTNAVVDQGQVTVLE